MNVADATIHADLVVIGSILMAIGFLVILIGVALGNKLLQIRDELKRR